MASRTITPRQTSQNHARISLPSPDCRDYNSRSHPIASGAIGCGPPHPAGGIMTRIPAVRHWLFLTLLAGLATLAPMPVSTSEQPDAKADGVLPAEWTKSFAWRNIGPANMSGRVTAISVFEADPSTYWVATASGGLVKTVN